MADPIRPPVLLSFDEIIQLAEIRGDIANGERSWHEAYEYIHSRIQYRPNIDHNTKFWFSQAIEINQGEGPAADFIRTYTLNGLEHAGQPPANLGEVTDAIAERVVEDILLSGAIPDLSSILNRDIRVAMEEAGIANLGGWGGTFYYWDIAYLDENGDPQIGADGQIITVGDTILNDQDSLDLFIDTLSTTLQDFFRVDNLLLIKEGSVREAMSRVLGLPNEVLLPVLDKTLSISETFKAAWDSYTHFPLGVPGGQAQWLFERISYEPGAASTSAELHRRLAAIAEFFEELNRAKREDVDNIRRIESFGYIGARFGSALAVALPTDSVFEEIAASAVLSALGENLEQAVRNGGFVYEGNVLSHEIFDDFFSDVGQNLAAGAIGTVSSFLTAELVQQLGLEGTLGELGNATGTAAISALIQNLPQIADGTTSVADVLQGVDIANVVGGFVGTRIAASLVEFDTIGGQIGASVGSAVGSAWAASAFTTAASTGEGVAIGAKLGAWAGPVGAAVGAVAGYLFGGFIGSLFGGTPRSGADLAWRGSNDGFAVSRSWSKNGASAEGAESFAGAVAGVMNGVIKASGSKVVDTGSIRAGSYGTHKKDFVYRATSGPESGHITFRTRDADALINHGAAIGVTDIVTRLIGGNVFVKRAVLATLEQSNVNASSTYGGAAGSFEVSALLGNIAVANDYHAYFSNPSVIHSLIAAEPGSAFAAAWATTIARSIELGLNKRASTDWTGGWAAFLDETRTGAIDGVSFAPSNLQTFLEPESTERQFRFRDGEGEVLGTLGDTIEQVSKDVIAGTSGDDTITITGDTIADAAGLTLNDAAAPVGPFVIDIAALIDGGAGNDTIRAGDLGNDVLGGAGNDTLIGGRLDDWLFGGTGSDRLFAGEANASFADGDAAGTAAAIAVDGGNGNLLDGGDGDDALYGSAGSDWLRGGDGVDLIYGGAGGDILDGGAGDDTGPSGEARLFGGGGTDQYVLEYGSGVDTVFDDADVSAVPGSSVDSFHNRLQQIEGGLLLRNWAGGGDYEVDGSVRGGEDAVVFGAGIGMQDLILQRSGQDLEIRLTEVVNENNRVETGDQLVIKDWFESTRRVEWLRFADGEEVRIADIQSFIVGSSVSDVIVGSNEADFMYGGAGDDVMWGLDGNDFGFGGAGNDLVAGDGDNDWVAGGLNDDKVIGGAGHDTVFGDGGDDEVYGGAGSDIVAGGRGDDIVVGGSGDDVFRYQRGDGRDVLLDDYVDNWEVVWQSGSYTNGYALNGSSGAVTKNGETYFDGSEWIGRYDFDYPSLTFRRHLGAVNGAIAANAGTDYLEFGVGIDLQDLVFRRSGNDLEIAVAENGGDAMAFDDIADRITVADWYATGNSIENFVFLATGRHQVTGWNLSGGTDGADTLTGGSGVDWITGGTGDDTLVGNGGGDILSGNAGADLIRGGAGDDVLYGGSGDDILQGGAGADTLIGGSGFDIVSYADADASHQGMLAFLDAPIANTLAGAGDTFVEIEGIEGTSGDDILGGDANANVLRGAGGFDMLAGGAGDDIYEFELGHGTDIIADVPFVTEEILDAQGGLNTALFTAQWINTYAGDDGTGGSMWAYQLIVTHNVTDEEIYRSGEFEFVYSSPASGPPPGNSWPASGWTPAAGAPMPTGNGAQMVRLVPDVDGDGGDDTLALGSGISLSDLTFAMQSDSLAVSFVNGDSMTISGQEIPNLAVESLQLDDGLTADLTRLVLPGEAATAYADFVVGDGGANTLDGLAGDDVLSGAGGDDVLRGGDGNDVLEGGAGADSLDGGDDAVSDGLDPSMDDQTRGYGDTIRYVGSDAAVTIDLAARTAAGGHATGDVIVASGGVSTIENVVGSDGYSDTLRGDARANRLAGLGGDDTLEGRDGDDVLVGGLGNDQLLGGSGEDNLAGGEGADVLEGGDGNDLLAGGAGDDVLRGDAGADVLSGGSGSDTLYGGGDDDQLGGDAGDDLLYGGAGDDRIAGGDGDDELYGGDGADELAGQAGDDLLSGGPGDDVYFVDTDSGSDVIVDADGRNRVVIGGGVTREQLWMTRSADDLRIAVIGGTTTVTLRDYYASANPTRVWAIALDAESLFLGYAEPLISEMTATSATTPAEMPEEIAMYVADYWHAHGQSAPTVQDESVMTDEDTTVSGTVLAVDHDENIVSFALEAEPDRGSVTVDAATGDWTYTPDADLWGLDSFGILVTDEDGNTALQTVTVTVESVNDAPSDVLLEDAVSAIEERDHPEQGTVLGAVVLGTLSAVDVDAPDPGDFASHVFTVSDERFEIVDENVLRLRANEALDYEAGSTVSVDVTATDRNGEGLSYTRGFTFDVLDRDDYFYGTSADDAITGQAGRNIIYGQGGDDVLTGAGTDDDLDGGDGADLLRGQGGDDVLRGGLGDDDLEGGTGSDALWGGAGDDTLQGQDGDDTLNGEGGADVLIGGAGHDQLDGGADNDHLEGGAGDDHLAGGSGDDLLIGGSGADSFLGGAGTDTVSYASAPSGVAIDLSTGIGSAGEATGDVFEDAPERIVGSAFADTIVGSSAAETLEGGAGNDTIYGGDGDDILVGGAGDDYLDAQSGNDTLIGGAGNDILIGGDDSDTYLIDIGSGADEIRNFDPNGTDIDVVGYQDINHDQLWFQRSGDDLIVSVVGTSVETTVKDWYLLTNASDRANYKIDFFLAGEHVTDTVDAEALVNLMAGYARPATQAGYDALHGDSAFANAWNAAWGFNAPPTVPAIGAQSINEDGTLTLEVRVTDDITPAAGVTVTAQAVRPDDHDIVDTSIVNPPTVGAADSDGDRTLTVTTKPNASGQVAIRLLAVDAGGLETERVFLLDITPVADAPTLPVVTVATPQPPISKPTLDSGSWAMDLQGALTDQDGSEVLDVRVSNVPSGISFDSGTNLGGGVWSFGGGSWPTAIIGPANWSQDLELTVTATARETANDDTASISVPLDIEINARPTDLWADRTLAFNENTASGTNLAWFGRNDGDSGDTATYTLLNNAGGRFTLRSDGLLRAGSTSLDYESAASHTIQVRVTDSGGLSRTENFAIAVNDVNEAPTGISADRTLAFNENLAAGTGLAWFSASDPEGNIDSYSLVNNAGGRFSIRSDGLLRAGSTKLDYESGTSHSITVRATDAGGLHRDQTFTVNVKDVDESPTINSGSFSIYEGAHGGPGTRLRTTSGAYARVTGSDPEGATLKYQLVGGDTSVLSIDSAGYLRIQGVMDYESHPTYSVKARAWDGGAVGQGNYADKWITINTQNVNEAPSVGFVNRSGTAPINTQWHEGTITGTDPEGGAVTYEVVSAYVYYQYQSSWIGSWADWDTWLLDYTVNASNGKIHVVWEQGSALYEPEDHYWFLEMHFNVRARDASGLTSETIGITTGRGSTYSVGPEWHPPVVLDLDGDGVELVSLETSSVRFKANEDSAPTRTGWIGSDDGVLALDRNEDGVITHVGEISFVDDLPGAATDLEGLAAFDTNGDGRFDTGDARYAEFLVWRDANQDGVSQDHELRSLADHGITSISLERSPTGETTLGARDNVVTATSQFTRDDGTTGLVGDVVLASEREASRPMPGLDAFQTLVDARPERAPLSNGAEPPRRTELEPLSIDGIDRSADGVDAGSPGPELASDTLLSSSPMQSTGNSFADRYRRSGAPARSSIEGQEVSRTARRTDRRWPDLHGNGVIRDEAVAAIGGSPAVQQTALHASLDSVARRRLQMIEAMASFAPEGAAELALQPRRSVDPRTLELLTSVPEIRVA